MSAAFTGPSRGLGIELYRGCMACIRSVNEAGGIHGRKIVVKVADDGYNPVPAIQNTIDFIQRDGVFMLMGYVGTPTVTRILPLLTRYSDQSVFLFFPFTGAQPQREPPYERYVFNLRASYRQETRGLVDHFVKIGRKSIGVFYQVDAFGRSGWDGVKRALACHNTDIVGEATYHRGAAFDESFLPQVGSLRATGADAIICVGAYAACAGFIRDARDAGWDVPIANVSFVGSENLLGLLLEAGKTRARSLTTNLVNTQVVPSYEDTSLPAIREYRRLMDESNPEPPAHLVEKGYQPVRYSFVSLEGFLNARVLIEILRRMGPRPTRENIRGVVEQIRQLDLGVNAPISFGPDRHQGCDAVYYTTVKDGRFVPFDWREWAR
ncbi:MAG: ABC transporter substrate-binding protein [Candidatus Riflebacteria bacterium]|nr:ABC transporter substrate-binding protein [Candidatus Riflebacteria bacterium]